MPDLITAADSLIFLRNNLSKLLHNFAFLKIETNLYDLTSEFFSNSWFVNPYNIWAVSPMKTKTYIVFSLVWKTLKGCVIGFFENFMLYTNHRHVFWACAESTALLKILKPQLILWQSDLRLLYMKCFTILFKYVSVTCLYF